MKGLWWCASQPFVQSPRQYVYTGFNDVGRLMDGRSYTLIVALALAGSAMAGCIENPDWLNTNSAEVSAFENKAAADEAALAWSPNATLVGVMAFELSETPDPRIDSDPDPGNGLAPAWWYIYCDTEAQDASLKAFKVTSSGNVSSERDAEALAMGMDHSQAKKLGEWSIDSDDALTAAKADESFAKVAQGFNATIVEGVADQEGLTAWWVSAMSVEGFVVASVDAATGELVHVETIDMATKMPDFQWGAANPSLMGTPVHLEGAGAAGAGDEPAEQAFTTTSPVWGTMSFTYSASAPMDGLHWAITNSDGEWMIEDHLSSWSGDQDDYEMQVEIPDAGDYTLSIGYMSSFGQFIPLPVGGNVDYTFVLDLMPGQMPDDEEAQH
jgi:hypothetical protein